MISSESLLLDGSSLRPTASGFQSTADADADETPDLTTDDYAETQSSVNEQKTMDFVLPLIKEVRAKTVLDVGCGVGRMVSTLCSQGLDCYGVDLGGLVARWKHHGLTNDRMFIVGSDRMRLPFRDRSLDFAFTLGVIEHVGTSDGHATRRPDYREVRANWTREIFRTLKVGGSMLLAGPNRGFPIDVAHGLDAEASRLERWASAKLRASIHRTWGEYFLWSYSDAKEALAGCRYEMRPLSVARYVHYSRVPTPLRGLVRGYVEHLPESLLGTGFNPWMAALIRRLE